LKLEASPTAPGKKLMTDQDIWIQHAAINSLNAVFGQKDSTEHETNFRENVVKNRTKSGIKEPKSVHVNCQNPRYGPRYLQKRKRRSDSMHNNKFFECNNSPELNSRIELKLEASSTAPSKKQMSEQDIGIQHAATNSLNAESGQKDSTH
jgi:hypothetical protein